MGSQTPVLVPRFFFFYGREEKNQLIILKCILAAASDACLHWDALNTKMYFSHSYLHTCKGISTCSLCYIPATGIHWCGLAEMGISSVWNHIISAKCVNCCCHFLWCLLGVRLSMGREQFRRSSMKVYMSWLTDEYWICKTGLHCVFSCPASWAFHFRLKFETHLTHIWEE